MQSRKVLTGVLAGALALVPGVAFADTDQTVEQIDQAAAAEQATPTATNPEVSIPSSGTGLVTLGGFGSGGPDAEHSGVVVELPEVALDLPARGLADQAGETTVFDGAAAGAQVAVQPTAAGVRTLVQIGGPEAPERYPFGVSGDVVRLEAQPDGSVTGYDAEGEPVAYIAPAWARDADGRELPTFYELEGTTLVQVVQHRGGDWAYPVTADPSLEWHWYWPHKARVWFSRAETEKVYRHLYGPPPRPALPPRAPAATSLSGTSGWPATGRCSPRSATSPGTSRRRTTAEGASPSISNGFPIPRSIGMTGAEADADSRRDPPGCSPGTVRRHVAPSGAT